MDNCGEPAKPAALTISAYLLTIMGLVALTSCNNGGSNSTYDSQAQNAQNERTGITSTRPFFATQAEPDYPTPDTTAEGRFLIRGNCIIFMSRRGTEYLPVLPYGTLYAPRPNSTLFQVQGRNVLANTFYVVTGAPSEYALKEKPLSACPKATFLIGEVR